MGNILVRGIDERLYVNSTFPKADNAPRDLLPDPKDHHGGDPKRVPDVDFILDLRGLKPNSKSYGGSGGGHRRMCGALHRRGQRKKSYFCHFRSCYYAHQKTVIFVTPVAAKTIATPSNSPVDVSKKEIPLLATSKADVSVR